MDSLLCLPLRVGHSSYPLQDHSPPSLSSSSSSSILIMLDCICEPDHNASGDPYSHWLGVLFHDCVYSTPEKLSVLLGLVNILLWIPAFYPQFLNNYRTKQAESLSPFFLLIWLVGDISNLLGCIFTHQFPTQLITAIYFICSDALILSQVLYYTYLYRGNKKNGEKRIGNGNGDDSDPENSLPITTYGSVHPSSSSASSSSSSSSSTNGVTRAYVGLLFVFSIFSFSAFHSPSFHSFSVDSSPSFASFQPLSSSSFSPSSLSSLPTSRVLLSSSDSSSSYQM